MARKRKSGKIIVRMKSTASSYFRTCLAHPRAEKMLIRMYDPVVRRHVEFKQTKDK